MKNSLSSEVEEINLKIHFAKGHVEVRETYWKFHPPSEFGGDC